MPDTTKCLISVGYFDQTEWIYILDRTLKYVETREFATGKESLQLQEMLSTNTWYLYLTFRTLQLLHTASFPTCIPIIISRKFLHQLYWSIGLAWFVHFTFYSFPDLYISPLMSAPLPTHSNESSSSELTQLKVTRLCKTFEGFYMS